MLDEDCCAGLSQARAAGDLGKANEWRRPGERVHLAAVVDG
jgi:hypothetical protein